MVEIVAELNDTGCTARRRAAPARQWLNDRLIAFAFEELGALSDQAVVLLEPATVYLALMLRDSATMRICSPWAARHRWPSGSPRQNWC